MYVLPCFDSVLTWCPFLALEDFPEAQKLCSQERQGALFIKQGLYKGAVFKPRARE